MITLRNLREDDAPLMLEWMHDPAVQKGFKKKMMSATLEDAKAFIKSANAADTTANGACIHLAIAYENDEYLGTVSLKNIDYDNKTAEYAITTRKKAHGAGVAFYATGLILKKAFNELSLHRVYLSVYSNNSSAISLYEKSGFKFEGEFREHFCIDGEYVNWKWYGILKDEFREEIFDAASV